MGISDFFQGPEYAIKILIISDIFQSESAYKGRLSKDYQNLSAVLYLDHDDMKAWSIKDGSNVTVSNEVGEVVIIARDGGRKHRGIGLMPPSIYSMKIASFDESADLLPHLIDAKIRRGDGEVMDIMELLYSPEIFDLINPT
jgi:formylmethanofuran dehydrogenase subunit D